jgi:hypothetical protein
MKVRIKEVYGSSWYRLLGFRRGPKKGKRKRIGGFRV